MADRPETPRTPQYGFHFEPVADRSWRLVSGRSCRYMVNRRGCKKPSVAEFRRGSSNNGRAWFAYCEEHLYGRWVEDGAVMSWRLVPDA